MIKLLIIAPQNPYPANDGGKIGIYYPVVHLAKHFEVHFAFITSLPVNQDVFDHFKKHHVSIYPQIKNTNDSALGYFSNLTSRLPFKFQKYCSNQILGELDQICETNNIMHVWCNHSHVAWYGLQLKSKRGVSIYLREHNIEYSLVQQVMEVQMNPLVRTFVKYQYTKTKIFEEKCWSEFSKTFFISDSDIALANQAASNNRLSLLYDGIAEIERPAKVEKEAYSFIVTASVQTFQNQYNLQKFIDEIWNRLVEKDARWKLYITGNKDATLSQHIKGDFSRLNIINLGFVDNISSAIASKSYFISPTYIGSGVRIKVLNALAVGAVCFVTGKDLAMLSILKDGYNIEKFNEFDDFYSKLLRLNSNQALYDSIALNALEVCNGFSWNEYAETVYNEIAKVESITTR